jgi:hypothetical protein
MIKLTKQELKILIDCKEGNSFKIQKLKKSHNDLFEKLKILPESSSKRNIILEAYVEEYSFLQQSNNLRNFFKVLNEKGVSRQKRALEKYPYLYEQIITYINSLPTIIQENVSFGELLDCWIENSYEKYAWLVGQEGYDYLVCPECGKRVQEINLSHAKMHGFNSIAELLEKHNMRSGKAQSQHDRIKGENNPAYQHGGKNSPFSEKYIAYENLTEDEKKQKIKNTYSKIHS